MADPGASGLQTFFLVTLPYILSAVMGGGLLSFTLSFDKMPITFFGAGRDNTLPVYIWSIMRRDITSEIDSVDPLIVAASAVLIIASVLLLRERSNAR